jgi:hypothetical protein
MFSLKFDKKLKKWPPVQDKLNRIYPSSLEKMATVIIDFQDISKLIKEEYIEFLAQGDDEIVDVHCLSLHSFTIFLRFSLRLPT